MKDAMDNYAKQFDGKVEITFVDAKEEAAKQLGQVENFIVQASQPSRNQSFSRQITVFFSAADSLAEGRPINGLKQLAHQGKRL